MLKISGFHVETVGFQNFLLDLFFTIRSFWLRFLYSLSFAAVRACLYSLFNFRGLSFMIVPDVFKSLQEFCSTSRYRISNRQLLILQEFQELHRCAMLWHARLTCQTGPFAISWGWGVLGQSRFFRTSGSARKRDRLGWRRRLVFLGAIGWLFFRLLVCLLSWPKRLCWDYSNNHRLLMVRVKFSPKKVF